MGSARALEDEDRGGDGRDDDSGFDNDDDDDAAALALGDDAEASDGVGGVVMASMTCLSVNIAYS